MAHSVYHTQPTVKHLPTFTTGPRYHAASSAWLVRAAALVFFSAALLAITGCKDAGKTGGGASSTPPLVVPPGAATPAAEPAPSASAPMDDASAAK